MSNAMDFQFNQENNFPAPKKENFGCAKGCLIGCGCLGLLSVLFIAGIILLLVIGLFALKEEVTPPINAILADYNNNDMKAVCSKFVIRDDNEFNECVDAMEYTYELHGKCLDETLPFNGTNIEIQDKSNYVQETVNTTLEFEKTGKNQIEFILIKNSENDDVKFFKFKFKD